MSRCYRLSWDVAEYPWAHERGIAAEVDCRSGGPGLRRFSLILFALQLPNKPEILFWAKVCNVYRSRRVET